jgi:hypothetical protein
MNVYTLTKDPVQRAEAVTALTKLLSNLSGVHAWQVSIKQLRQKRSPEQNSYWRAVPIKMISAYTGHDPDEINEYLCGERFGWVQIEVFGKKRHRPVKTSSELTVQEFSGLIEWTQAWAASQLGMIIPSPNEVIT